MALSKKLYACVILCVLVCAAGARASEATAGATSTDKIKHIVVLMLENRSFDHMIGFLRGNNTDIDGCTAERAATDAACTCPEDPTQAGSPRVPVDNEAIYVQPADPGHSLQQTTDQLYGFGPVTGAPAPMSGFIKSYAPIMDNSTGTADGSFIMKCFAPSHVPVISTLASEFTLIDHWYSGIPGPTEVNRAYANSATSHGYISNDEIVEHLGMPQRTIFESLADAGADWNVYYHDYASVLLFRYPWLHLDHIHKWDKFADDVAKGDLPQYTWLEPQYYDSGSKAAQDQHPDHDVAEGELLMKEVYDALRASPMWNETLLLVTYDEHGGFFDHVPPLNNVPNPDGLNSTNPPFNFTRIGVRVPAIVVSPWVEPGVVVHGPAEGNGNAFCHSSIPATVRKLFAPSEPFLTKRDAWASTFDELLTLDAPRTNCPSSMPTPALHRDLVPHLLPKLDGKMPLSDLQKGFVQTVAAKMGDSSMTDDVLAKMAEGEGGQYVERMVDLAKRQAAAE